MTTIGTRIVQAVKDFWETTDKGTEWEIYYEAAKETAVDLIGRNLPLHEILSWHFCPEATLDIEWFLYHPTQEANHANRPDRI